MKLLKNDFNYIKKMISQYESEDLINKFPNFEIIDIPVSYRYLELILQPGIYELTDLNTAIRQKLQFYNTTYKTNGKFLNIQADTISMKSILTT